MKLKQTSLFVRYSSVFSDPIESGCGLILGFLISTYILVSMLAAVTFFGANFIAVFSFPMPENLVLQVFLSLLAGLSIIASIAAMAFAGFCLCQKIEIE